MNFCSRKSEVHTAIETVHHKNVAFMCHLLIYVPRPRRVEPFIPCTKTCVVYLCMYVCIFTTHECYEVCMYFIWILYIYFVNVRRR